MARSDTFTIRVNDDERKAIRELADRLQRTESDAIRFVVREKARELATKATSDEANHVRAN